MRRSGYSAAAAAFACFPHWESAPMNGVSFPVWVREVILSPRSMYVCANVENGDFRFSSHPLQQGRGSVYVCVCGRTKKKLRKALLGEDIAATAVEAKKYI